LRAQRRARKEVGLGNALPLMVEGSKAHSKRSEGSKARSKNVRARRRTQKEVGLGNALP
jgi:hypothetical protein